MKLRLLITTIVAAQLGAVSLCLPAVSCFSSEHYNSAEYLKRVKSEPVQYPALTENNVIVQWLCNKNQISWHNERLAKFWKSVKQDIKKQSTAFDFVIFVATYLRELVQNYHDTIECPLNDYMCLTHELNEKFKHHQQNQDQTEFVNMYQQCIKNVHAYLRDKEYSFFHCSYVYNPQSVFMCGLTSQPFPGIYDAAADWAQELLEGIYDQKHFAVVNNQ